MKEIKNKYFRMLHDEQSDLERLPPSSEGPYRFVNCEIHPRLWSSIQQIYKPKGCEFVNTHIGSRII